MTCEVMIIGPNDAKIKLLLSPVPPPALPLHPATTPVTAIVVTTAAGSIPFATQPAVSSVWRRGRNPHDVRHSESELRGNAGQWVEGCGVRSSSGRWRDAGGPLFRCPFAGSDSGKDDEEGCATDISIATPACWTQGRGRHAGGGGVRRVGDVQTYLFGPHKKH